MARIVVPSICAVVVAVALLGGCETFEESGPKQAYGDAVQQEHSGKDISAIAASLIASDPEFYPYYYLKFRGDSRSRANHGDKQRALLIEDARDFVRYDDGAASRYVRGDSADEVAGLVSPTERAWMFSVVARAKAASEQWDDELLRFASAGIVAARDAKEKKDEYLSFLYFVRAQGQLHTKKNVTDDGKGFLDAVVRDCESSIAAKPGYFPPYGLRVLALSLEMDGERALDALDQAGSADPAATFAALKEDEWDLGWLSSWDDQDMLVTYRGVCVRIAGKVSALLQAENVPRSTLDSVVNALCASYATAAKAWRAGDFDTAEDEASDMLAVSPSFYPAYLIKTDVDYSRMEKAGKRTVEEGRRIVGDVDAFFSRQDDGGWTKTMRSSFPVIPEASVAGMYGLRAVGLILTGNFAGAITDADRQIAECQRIGDDRGRAHGLYVRGLARHSSGDRAAAESDYTQSVALDPTDWWPCYYLSLIYGERKDTPRAVDMLRRMTKLAPDYTRTIMRSGRQYDWLRDSADFKKLLE